MLLWHAFTGAGHLLNAMTATAQCLPTPGSFGSVYLAEWNQTLVACKVLITQGASQVAAEGRDGLASVVPSTSHSACHVS